MTKLINFPNINKTNKEFFATCPTCSSNSWLIVVDDINFKKLQSFRCSDCDYSINLDVHFSMVDK